MFPIRAPSKKWINTCRHNNQSVYTNRDRQIYPICPDTQKQHARTHHVFPVQSMLHICKSSAIHRYLPPPGDRTFVAVVVVTIVGSVRRTAKVIKTHPKCEITLCTCGIPRASPGRALRVCRKHRIGYIAAI